MCVNITKDNAFINLQEVRNRCLVSGSAAAGRWDVDVSQYQVGSVDLYPDSKLFDVGVGSWKREESFQSILVILIIIPASPLQLNWMIRISTYGVKVFLDAVGRGAGSGRVGIVMGIDFPGEQQGATKEFVLSRSDDNSEHFLKWHHRSHFLQRTEV